VPLFLPKLRFGFRPLVLPVLRIGTGFFLSLDAGTVLHPPAGAGLSFDAATLCRIGAYWSY
jgi:hypothetical protein